MQQISIHALIADILATLEANGQPFGLGAHLSIGELLQNLPENTPPAQIKTLLSPLLCKTKEEQAHFYEIFDRSWKRVQSVGVLEDDAFHGRTFSIARKRISPWPALAVALILTGLWCMGHWAGITSRLEIPVAETSVELTLGDPEAWLVIDSSRIAFDGRSSRIDPFSTFSRLKEDGHAGIRLDTQQNRIYFRGASVGSDTLFLQTYPHNWHHAHIWRHQVVFHVVPPPDTTRRATEPLDTALYVQREIPNPRDLNQLEVPTPTPLQQFLVDWEWPLKLGGFMLAALLAWLAARLWERDRRKLIAEHRPNQKPPYAWNIELKNPPRVDLGERFQRLLNQFRRREADESWRLDLHRTVRATVAKGGIPQFRYTQQTRPSEYLLLIDRHSPRNHYAQLFDLVATSFRNQEILLERFWYDGDPRLCWNEANPAGLDLRALHYHYPQSRLLLLGDASHLINLETGRLTKWAQQTFSAWQDCAVLSPKPLEDWGRREHTLQALFHVLPASLSALAEAIERFDTDFEKDLSLDPRRFPDAIHSSVKLVENDLVKTIRHYFDKETGSASGAEGQQPDTPLSTWIAACAVYPELHWDMTLYLGDLLSDPDSMLLSAENIAQICRLPWFTEGEIPLEARKALIAWLETEHPETLYRIREGIHRLLAQNPPPEGSAAHDAHAMNMALNEWLYTKDSARKKELEKDILRRIAAGQAADFMVLKLLDGPQSPEAFEVPENWRKHLKQKGLAKTTGRAWVWALPLWLMMCLVVWAWKPSFKIKGVIVEYDEQEYFLQDNESFAIFSEMVLEDSLALGNWYVELQLANNTPFGWKNFDFYSKLDGPNEVMLVDGKYLSIGKPFGNWAKDTSAVSLNINSSSRSAIFLIRQNESNPWVDSVQFLQNTAVLYFNYAIAIRETLPDSACSLFLRAQTLNARLPSENRLWFVQKAAYNCNPGTFQSQGELIASITGPNSGPTETDNVDIVKAFDAQLLETNLILANPKPFDEAKASMDKDLLNISDFDSEISALEGMTNRSVSLHGKYQKLTYYRGLQLYQNNQKENARIHFNKSMAFPVDKRIATLCSFWLGSIAHETGEYSLSIPHMTSFLNTAKSYSNLPEGSNLTVGNYIQGYNYLKVRDYPSAMLHLKVTVEGLKRGDVRKEPRRSDMLGDAVLRLADCYFKSSQYNEALAFYNEAITRKYLGFEYAIYQKAIILGLQGKNLDKVQMLEGLVAQYPNSIFVDEPLFQLGDTYFVLDKLNRAVPPLRKLATDFRGKSPLVVPALLKLGLIQYNLGAYSLAINYYKDVFANNPDDQDAKEAIWALEIIYKEINKPEEFKAFLESLPANKKDKIINSSSGQGSESVPILNKETESPVKIALSDMDVPSFPFPPPQASSTYSLPSNIFEGSKTLGDVNRKLTKALDAAGYAQRGYFQAPNGFVIVTQLEQIDANGNSKAEANRWSKNFEPKTEGVFDNLKSLMFANEGYFRLYTFIVTDMPFTVNQGIAGVNNGSSRMGFEESSSYQNTGLVRLPQKITAIAYTKGYFVTAMVYEFKVTASNKTASLILPGRLTGNTHLEKSGILSALKK